ncbi:MAG: SpaA isopeptide-forming pilin-related protein [Saccharofermentanales bacterium]|jgi:LPXTG-motif cell wall-anchored protein
MIKHKTKKLGLLLLVFLLIIQIIYPGITRAGETTTAIQGISHLTENKNKLSIRINPEKIEETNLLPILIESEKLSTETDNPQDNAVDRVSTLIYHKQLTISDNTIETFKDMGFSVEKGADLIAEQEASEQAAEEQAAAEATETTAAETTVAETTAAETIAAETTAAETTVTETTAVETIAAEATVAETTAAETTAAETTVAETTAAETTAAETTIAETTAAETTTSETTVSETTVAETTPVETTAAETTVAETTAAETTVAETTAAETTAAETTVAETTPAETTVSETLPAETSAPDPQSATEDETETSGLIDYGAEYDFLRLTLTPETEAEILDILEKNHADDSYYQELQDKANAGNTLSKSEKQILAVLNNFTYTVEPYKNAAGEESDSVTVATISLALTLDQPTSITNADLLAFTTERKTYSYRAVLNADEKAAQIAAIEQEIAAQEAAASDESETSEEENNPASQEDAAAQGTETTEEETPQEEPAEKDVVEGTENTTETTDGFSLPQTMKMSSRSPARNRSGNKVTITKTDPDSVALTGAEFGLYDENGENPILKDGNPWTEISNQEGILTFDNISQGTYVIKEVQAPEGFNPTSETWKIAVGEDGRISLFQSAGTSGYNELRAGTIVYSTDTNHFAVAGSRIIDVDTVNKTFTQLVYVNPWVYRPNGLAVQYNQDSFNPTLYLTPFAETGYQSCVYPSETPEGIPAVKSGAANSSGTVITSAEVYRVYDVNMTTMPVNFEVNLEDTSKYVKSTNITPVTYNTNGLSLSFGKNFLVPYTGYPYASGAIVKVTGTYNGAIADKNLITSSRFTYYAGQSYGYRHAQSWNEVQPYTNSDVWTDPELNLAITAVNNPKTGELTVTNVDGDNAPTYPVIYETAKFTLTDSNGNSITESTNYSTGQVTFSNLAPGTYTLRETLTPAGYLPSGAVWTVTVVDDGTLTTTTLAPTTEHPDPYWETLNNPPDSNLGYRIGNKQLVTRDLVVKKTDGNGNALSGAEFTLYQRPETFYGVKTVQLTQSNSGGDIIHTAENLPVPGYYFLRETVTPATYAAPDYQWIVHMTEDDTKFWKVPINPIWKNDGTFITDPGWNIAPDGTRDPNPPASNPYEPDAISGPTIKPGDLSMFKESATKEQNTWTNPEADFTTSDISANPLTVENLLENNVTITKKWVDENAVEQTLTGARFGLFAENGTDPVMKDGKAWTEISNQEGILTFDNLSPGTYVIKETLAPQGYTATEETWKIEVKPDGKISYLQSPGTSGYNEIRGGQYGLSANGIAAINSKIIEVDTVNKTFTQLIYVNKWTDKYWWKTHGYATSFDKYYFYPTLFIRHYGEGGYSAPSYTYASGYPPAPAFPAIPSDKAGITNTSGTGINSASVEVYRVNNVIDGDDLNTYMPDDFNVTLTDTTKYSLVNLTPTTYSDGSISLSFGSNILVPNPHPTIDYEPSGAIVKVTGTYNGDSIKNLITSSRLRYSPYEGYPNNYLQHAQSWNEIDPYTNPDVWTDPDTNLAITAINDRNTDPMPETGELEITKLGSDGTRLGDIDFGLFPGTNDQLTADSKPMYFGTTDAEGLLTLNNILPGTYTLKELETPAGYIKINDVWTIVVGQDGTTEVVSGGGTIVNPDPPAEPPAGTSNTTFPTWVGTLNSQTQVSSPSANQMNINYPSYPDPILYTSVQDGEYAVDFDQTGFIRTDPSDPNSVETLRNVWLADGDNNYGGYLTYRGNYQTYFNQDWHTIDFAKVAKYAEKTFPAVKDDHQYDITLKVTGNTYPEKEKDKLGVIILYDNSSSMGATVGSTGKTRATLAKEATTQFVNDLKAKNPEVEFALVTYGSTIFDGQYHTTNFNGSRYRAQTPNASYLGFTDDPSNITGRLPGRVPSSYSQPFFYFGGTFTGGAFLEAEKLVRQAQARTTNEFDRLVVVNVTDGVPTRSPIIEQVSTNAEGKKVTTFATVDDTGYYSNGVKGDGIYYRLFDSTSTEYHRTYTPPGLGQKVVNHGIPTELNSQNIKNLYAEVFNIGISVTGDDEISEAAAKTLMANISSGAGYNYDLTDANELPDAFASIINKVYRNTISSGIVTDPMGDKVELVLDSASAFVEGTDYTITATKGVNKEPAPELLNGVTATYDSTTRTIKLQGLNLGLNDEITLKYKVSLRAGDADVRENIYYFTNKETTLQPNPAAGMVAWNFPVPSVKKLGTEHPEIPPNLQITNYRKPSIEFYKTKVTGESLAGAKFQLYRTTVVGGVIVRTPVGNEITTVADQPMVFSDLDAGTYILVETQAPPGYKKLADPAVSFEVTDKGNITNVSGQDLNTSDGTNDIWNWRMPEMQLNLVKLDGNFSPVLVGDVKFTLTKASTNTGGGDVPPELQTISFTDLGLLQAGGNTLGITIPFGMDGEYILEESMAPGGYTRTTDKYHIVVSQAERTIKLVKLTDNLGNDQIYQYKDAQGTTVDHDLSADGPVILYTESGQEPGVKNQALSLDLGIVNQQAEYPATGGQGIRNYLIVGGVIMMFAGVMILRRKRRHGEYEKV